MKSSTFLLSHLKFFVASSLNGVPHRGLNPCNSEKEFARLLVVVLRGEYCARGDSIANMAGDKREGRGTVEEEEVVEVLVAIFALATDEKFFSADFMHFNAATGRSAALGRSQNNQFELRTLQREGKIPLKY
jgi:hypothetical protein